MRMIIDQWGSYFPGDSSFPTLARQMDHDLRSPLTTICSHAECLAWLPNLTPEAREMYARTIVVEGRRLGRMAANFLVLAAPPLSEELHELMVPEVLGEVLEDIGDFLEVRALTVECRVPPGTVAYWPPSVLKHLLTATIETGAEAVARDACLVCEATVSGDTLALQLQALGPGQGRIAESFAFRAVDSLARQRGGEVALEMTPALALRLRLPQMGRVCHVDDGVCLGKSA